MLLYPLNWLLNMSSRSTLKALGIKESPQHEILSDVEIEGLVEASAEHGKMPVGQAEYIHNVFRFGDLEVSDVMVHRTEMVTINADDPPEEIVSAVLAAPIHAVPLWRDAPENIIGILHAKDLLRAIQAAEGDLAKIDIVAIARPPWFVPDIRAVVRTTQGVPPPQDPLRARGRRVWRGHGACDTGGHSGGDRRRHLR